MAKAIVYEISVKDSASGALQTMKIKAKGAEDAMAKLTKAVEGASGGLKTGVVNVAAYNVALTTLNGAVNSLMGGIQGLVAAYAMQEEAETKLANNMRNTMGATEEQIQSVKDLCAAQQELGVIGDEVQLAGAQELATYLEKTDTLKTLIPVMNDMVAQQYGLNASQENATNVATMLGKVMDGQTGALSRYGYRFDETQEKILKYGTEAERAATLAEVVTASVGGMNAALAQTPTGQMKQLDNTVGDLKEKVGEFVSISMPFLEWATTGLTLCTSLHKIYVWITALSGAVKILSASLGVISILVAAGMAFYDAYADSTKKATEETDKLINEKERLGREAEALKSQHESETRAMQSSSATLSVYIAQLENFQGTKDQEKKLVKELNGVYGESMGYFSSVSEWYDALVANSEAYCRQMVIEARTRTLADQIAQKQQETHDIVYNADGSKRKYSTKRIEKIENVTMQSTAGAYTVSLKTGEFYDSDLDKAEEAVKANNAAIKHLQAQMAEAVVDASKIKFKVTGSATPPSKGGGGSATERTELQKINALIAEAKESYVQAEESERAEIGKTIAELVRKREALEALYREAEVSGMSREPLEFTTEGEFDKEISVLESDLGRVTASERKALEARIAQVRYLKSVFLGEIEGFRWKDGGGIAIDVKPIDPQSLFTTAKLPDDVKIENPLPDNKEVKKSSGSLQDGLSGAGKMMGSLSGLVGDSAGAWMDYGANILQTASQALPAILAMTCANAANSAAQTPVVGWIMAGAAIASMIAAFATIPKFADGGIAYGPTLGLFGEYAGASGNPEVVAPLNRLKELMGPADGGGGRLEQVDVRIDGRNLVAVLAKNGRYRERM